MACCAFAVFLAAQLLAPFIWLRRRVFGSASRSNPAVSWSLDRAVAAHAIRPTRRFRRLGTMAVALVGLELVLLLAVAAHWSTPARADTRYDEDWVAAQALLAPRCLPSALF